MTDPIEYRVGILKFIYFALFDSVEYEFEEARYNLQDQYRLICNDYDNMTDEIKKDKNELLPLIQEFNKKKTKLTSVIEDCLREYDPELHGADENTYVRRNLHQKYIIEQHNVDILLSDIADIERNIKIQENLIHELNLAKINIKSFLRSMSLADRIEKKTQILKDYKESDIIKSSTTSIRDKIFQSMAQDKKLSKLEIGLNNIGIMKEVLLSHQNEKNRSTLKNDTIDIILQDMRARNINHHTNGNIIQQ
jgi:hypothetical protein